MKEPIFDASYQTIFHDNKTRVNFSVYSFLDSSGEVNGLPILTKMKVLRTLVLQGDKPFYASDLFADETGSLGGWMNSLNNSGLITPTGRIKEVPVTINTWDGEKTFQWRIEEWKLAVPANKVWFALNIIRNFVLEHL